jgi:succinate dehydrogenase / fumarate reductase flavoprotein subunit
LSCIFDGLFGAPGVKNYCTDAAEFAADDVPQASFDAVVEQEEKKQQRLLESTGGENPYLLWQEMGRVMTDACTVVRQNDRLDRALARCQEWKARHSRVQLSDTGMWSNQNLSFARALGDMILMAEAILKGARLRDESRGAHYKPEFPDRDDVNFLKTTIATFNPRTGSAEISYTPVDTSLVPARPRTYGKKVEAPASERTASRKAG